MKSRTRAFVFSISTSIMAFAFVGGYLIVATPR